VYGRMRITSYWDTSIYYDIFSFWDHKLLLINDRSVQAAKKCDDCLKTVYGRMRITSYWDTSIYYDIFSFWDHKLLLINDRSVQAAKKCDDCLIIVIVGQDTIIYYY
jgi:hypothetical protein